MADVQGCVSISRIASLFRRRPRASMACGERERVQGLSKTELKMVVIFEGGGGVMFNFEGGVKGL
jgi:hypothetical protein